MTFPSEAAVAFEDVDVDVDLGEDEDEDEVMDVGFGVVLPIAGPCALDGGGECDKKLPPPAVVVPVKAAVVGPAFEVAGAAPPAAQGLVGIDPSKKVSKLERSKESATVERYGRQELSQPSKGYAPCVL